MRGHVRMIFPMIIASQLAHADVKRHEFVPEAMRGTWVSDTAACQKTNEAVVITDKTFVTPQAHCTVDWVSETPGEKGPIYSARMQCINMGESAPKTQSKILWPKSDTILALGSSFDDLQDYTHCPGR